MGRRPGRYERQPFPVVRKSRKNRLSLECCGRGSRLLPLAERIKFRRYVAFETCTPPCTPMNLGTLARRYRRRLFVGISASCPVCARDIMVQDMKQPGMAFCEPHLFRPLCDTITVSGVGVRTIAVPGCLFNLYRCFLWCNLPARSPRAGA